MFSKKAKSVGVNLSSGWTSELIQAVCRNPVERGLGFPSKDFSIFIDAVVFDSNNFEVERKAYGLLELRVGDTHTKVNIPVVASFIVDANELVLFNDRLSHTIISDIALQRRIYGEAILNAIIEETPVFEWCFYLSRDEWETVIDSLRLSGKSNLLRLGVRIGIPNSITETSIVNDSYNSRLIIHRIWLTATAVLSTQGLQGNKAFDFDMD